MSDSNTRNNYLKQSRMKLTWFGSAGLLIILLLCVIFKVDDLATILSVGFSSLTLMIMGYQGSRAYTTEVNNRIPPKKE